MLMDLIVVQQLMKYEVVLENGIIEFQPCNLGSELVYFSNQKSVHVEVSFPRFFVGENSAVVVSACVNWNALVFFQNYDANDFLQGPWAY